MIRPDVPDSTEEVDTRWFRPVAEMEAIRVMANII
jgi:hypothetical protein